MSSFPNQRGNAPRSSDRNTRYATHTPVLKACIKALGEDVNAIEHGMGLGSTPFFHSISNVKTITSFEREPEWAWCADCISGSLKPHSVVQLNDDTVFEQIKQVKSPEKTVALVDGYAAHRLGVLETWMKMGVALIVEHDAETFTSRELLARLTFANSAGYQTYQYVDLQPESMLYVSPGVHLSLTSSCVRL